MKRVMHSQQSGFTLIEVLVALIIVAVSLPALMYSISTQVNQLSYIEERLFAQWIADNEMTKLRIQYKQSGMVAKGKKSGTEAMAGSKWSWSRVSEEEKILEAKAIYTTTIQVFFDEEDDPKATQVGSFYDTKMKQPNLAALHDRARKLQEAAQGQGSTP
ncbi:MAG: type II secretion system minor pseudopilin GspI [Pseudomonadota bacterium]